ncbi:hypothetical protein HF324_31145 [Chitinophaga oryzae]|uniref:Uncharacterized protein n=1 Tax=Chitinophaga oryzae TaxID=2725414 RepID=A0AAE6ZMJ8_9BACT|nr:hypothetical protein [Chitinophaga oryzae]QJB35519.1 hypothetical protein HF329_31125 [Chitinophaga oryzae]QJB42062.1 hypothetical protein HF324_31145 [Chitinophaga oryzae]
MNNNKTVAPFQIETTRTTAAVVTRLTAIKGVSHKDNLNCGDQTLMANYVYNDRSYDTVYTLMDAVGVVIESYEEEDGILPTLFNSPTEEPFVSVVPYHPDKELEISIPVFNREQTERPKGNRPFTGDFIGVVKDTSLFYDGDKKPDRMLAIVFKDGIIKKKNNIKVPPPAQNKVYVTGEEIHLLAKDGEQWLHRLLNEKGEELRRRHFSLADKYPREIIHLSFDDGSCLLTEEEGQLELAIVDAAGNVTQKPLLDLGDPLFNTWPPVSIGPGASALRFNTEFGNGWMVIHNHQLAELFYSKGVKGYKNLVKDELISIPEGKLIISGLNKTRENALAVIIYPKSNKPKEEKTLIIINRTITTDGNG